MDKKKLKEKMYPILWAVILMLVVTVVLEGDTVVKMYDQLMADDEVLLQAYGTLNTTKTLILEQARTIENLSVMILTYQIWMLQEGIVPPEFDWITKSWMEDNLPKDPPGV